MRYHVSVSTPSPSSDLFFPQAVFFFVPIVSFLSLSTAVDTVLKNFEWDFTGVGFWEFWGMDFISRKNSLEKNKKEKETGKE